jgi:hypothetical protein
MPTYGADAVELSFNPSGDPDVHLIKRLYAEIIDLLYKHNPGTNMEKARLLSIAITEAQGAQMWAVKAITRKLTDV